MQPQGPRVGGLLVVLGKETSIAGRGQEDGGELWGCPDSKTEEGPNFCEIATPQELGREGFRVRTHSRREKALFFPLLLTWHASWPQDLEGIQTLSILGPQERTGEFIHVTC